MGVDANVVYRVGRRGQFWSGGKEGAGATMHW